MGTSASRASSPSPPSSCGLVKTDSTTQLFAVPDYSKWARMPAGSALNFDMFYLRGCDYSHYTLKVYPAGLDKESAQFVAVFVHGPFDDRYSLSLNAAVTSVSIEILDATGRHVVFDNHTARSEQTVRHHGRSKGYVRFVSRRELEASCCVREEDDSLTVRCTISVDREVTWPLTMAPPPPDEVAAGAMTAVGSRTVKIGGFSRLRAALQSGECAYTPHFSLGGSSWYFKVYPNGHGDATKDCVAVFLGRGKSDEPVTTAEFCFELADDDPVEDAGKEGAEFTKHRFDIDNPVHVSPYLVTSGDLASAEQMVSNDRLVVRCRIRVIKVTAPSLILPATAAPTVTATPSEGSDGKSPTNSPGVVAETGDEETSESDQTPLLADMHQG